MSGQQKALAVPYGLKITGASGSIGIAGGYAATDDVALDCLVTLRIEALMRGSGGEPSDRLRTAEAAVVAEILGKLASYDALKAERDELLRLAGAKKESPRSAGYSTQEIMRDNC